MNENVDWWRRQYHANILLKMVMLGDNVNIVSVSNLRNLISWIMRVNGVNSIFCLVTVRIFLGLWFDGLRV